MAIRYEVREGGLPTNPVQLRPVQSGIYTLDQLADEIAATNVAAPATVTAVLHAMPNCIINALLRSEAVHLDGLVQLRVTLGGKFENTGAVRTQDINVAVSADADKALAQEVRTRVQLEQAPTTSLDPQPDTLTAVHGDLNALAAGNVLQMMGYRLLFDPSQTDAGVFFRPASGGADVKVATIVTREGKKSVFIVPAGLTPGADYEIVIKARTNPGQPASPLHEGVAPQTVTMA